MALKLVPSSCVCHALSCIQILSHVHDEQGIIVVQVKWSRLA